MAWQTYKGDDVIQGVGFEGQVTRKDGSTEAVFVTRQTWSFLFNYPDKIPQFMRHHGCVEIEGPPPPEQPGPLSVPDRQAEMIGILLDSVRKAPHRGIVAYKEHEYVVDHDFILALYISVGNATFLTKSLDVVMLTSKQRNYIRAKLEKYRQDIADEGLLAVSAIKSATTDEELDAVVIPDWAKEEDI